MLTSLTESEQQIKALEKANRTLKKQLEKAELDCYQLEESNERKEALLRKVIQEVKEGEQNLKQLNEQLEGRVIERTSELSKTIQQLEEEMLDRKKAEEALRISEQNLRTIFDNVYEGILIFELDGTLIDVNSKILEIYGISREEALNLSILDYSITDKSEQISSFWHRSLAGEKQLFEGKAKRFNDGQIFNIETYLQKVTLDNKSVILANIRDISDRKIAEAKLREKEQFLRSVYDGVEHIIFAWDVTENREFKNAGWNAAAKKTSYIPIDNMFGKSPIEIFGEVMGTMFEQNLQKCLDMGESISYEECHIFNQQEICIITTLNPIKDEENRIYRIVGTGVDITDRKLAEQTLLTQARLSAFRADINVALTRSGDLQLILTGCTDAVVKHLDAAFARIWVFNPSDNMLRLQASSGLYSRINGDSAQFKFGEGKIGLIAKEMTPYLTNDLLNMPLLKNKEWAQQQGMVAFAGYPLIIDDTLLGVVGMFARQILPDTTLSELKLAADDIALGIKRKQAEAALQESQVQLRQQALELERTLQELKSTQAQIVQSEKMSSLGQLVAGVAHEINNPVNFIRGNLDYANDYTQNLLNLVKLYQESYPIPTPEIELEIEEIDLEFIMDDLPKLINSMHVGADRIQKIVASLRNFSRMDEAECKAVSIHEGIDSTLMILQHRLKSQADRPEIKIIKQYGDIPLVECYAGQLNQVFMNILSNSIDALEEALISDNLQQSPQILITTEWFGLSDIRISFKDNGVGIPENILSRLFDPFFTTKPVGKGTGMGLSISYQIITQKHQGSLICNSVLGQGAEFIIEIPRNQQIN